MQPTRDASTDCGDFDCGADADDVPVHFHADTYGYYCYGNPIAANVYQYTCVACGATHRHVYDPTDRDADS